MSHEFGEVGAIAPLPGGGSQEDQARLTRRDDLVRLTAGALAAYPMSNTGRNEDIAGAAFDIARWALSLIDKEVAHDPPPVP